MAAGNQISVSGAREHNLKDISLVLPRDALTPKYHSRMVVPVPFAKPVPTRRVALAYRRSFPRPAAIAAIREAVAACRPAKAKSS